MKTRLSGDGHLKAGGSNLRPGKAGGLMKSWEVDNPLETMYQILPEVKLK